MHLYKSLVVTATEVGPHARLTVTMTTGRSAMDACTATKRFGMPEFGEVRDILGWASHAFLTAADHLTEDGWEIRHLPDCQEPHAVVTDA